MGMAAGRRDDLESLCYTLIDLGTGDLPWKLGKGRDNIQEQKQQTSPEQLCKGLPSVFQYIVQYSKALEFVTRPDYAILIFQLKQALWEIKVKVAAFDWKLKCCEVKVY
jgi:casein kinase 1